MPHVTIEYFPREISLADKQAMAAEITVMLNKYMGVTADAVSVDLIEVAPDQWREQVYEPRIRPNLQTMLMKPGYVVADRSRRSDADILLVSAAGMSG